MVIRASSFDKQRVKQRLSDAVRKDNSQVQALKSKVLEQVKEGVKALQFQDVEVQVQIISRTERSLVYNKPQDDIEVGDRVEKRRCFRIVKQTVRRNMKMI